MLRRPLGAFALAALVVSGCSEADEKHPTTALTESSESARDLAGELGANGGVIEGSVELQSTPESLYPDQTQGATAVGPVAGLPAGLTVLRKGDRLCLGLHGLPIGGNELVESCDIAAYETHDEVERTDWAYLSEVELDGAVTWVAWGMTYRDVATVDVGPGSRFQRTESHFPYWMHRFFALEASAGASELRLMDEAGHEVATLPMERRA